MCLSHIFHQTLQGNCTGICHCVFVTSSFPDFNIMFFPPLEALKFNVKETQKAKMVIFPESVSVAL